tara:strand:+ start:22 stop:1443 length:1422 start_codon:yes stop_codon:yes gene_type:complete
MSVSNQNLVFYNCTNKSPNVVKYIIRIPKDHEPTNNILKEKFKSLGIIFKTSPKSTENDNDKSDYYYFNDYMYYNNKEAKEYKVSHTYLYVNEDDKQNILDIFESFNDYQIKKQPSGSFSVCINDSLVEKIPTNFTYISPSHLHDYENGKYPICIVSYKRGNIKDDKGKDLPRTAVLLNSMRIRCRLYYEPQEREIYQDNYRHLPYVELVECPQNFSELNEGSTPVRNYVLDTNQVCKRVWILDDNIKSFLRYYKGEKIPIKSGFIFKSVENYVDNHSLLNLNKIGVVSLNYAAKIFGKAQRPVIVENGKSYSCMLIPTESLREDGSLIRFEGKHQEDNFLSLDFICNGYTTLCFNHIFYDKNTSGVDKGGNRESIYKDDDKQKGRIERTEFFINKTKRLLQQGIIKPNKKSYKLNDLLISSPQKNEEVHMKFIYTKIKSTPLKPINYNDRTWDDPLWDNYKINVNSMELVES